MPVLLKDLEFKTDPEMAVSWPWLVANFTLRGSTVTVYKKDHTKKVADYPGEYVISWDLPGERNVWGGLREGCDHYLEPIEAQCILYELTKDMGL